MVRAYEFNEATINKKYSQLEISLSLPGEEIVLVHKKTRMSGKQIDQYITQWFRKNADEAELNRNVDKFISPKEFKASSIRWQVGGPTTGDPMTQPDHGVGVWAWIGRYRIGIDPSDEVRAYYSGWLDNS